jgi:molecular chaperone GrpE
MLHDEQPTIDEGGGPAAAAAPDRDELQDRLLRVTAEFDNYRKRTDRERRELWAMATADVIRDVLPVIDDLERALGAPSDQPGADSIRRGLELILRQLLDTLKKRGVEPIDTVGQLFDPHIHEAVANEPAHGRRDGEIVAELRRGYRLGDKLLRAATVRVAQS